MNGFLKSLKTAISNVMERMFFLLPDPDDGTDVGTVKGYDVSIGITGNPRFRITLTFDPALASAMAANALGGDAARDEGTVRKCLLEATNVVAGNVLQAWDDGKNREITLPSFRRGDIFGSVSFSESRTIGLRFEDQGVSVLIETVSGHS